MYKYNPADADFQLSAMSALGYNLVRVFVSELGLNDFDDGQGLDINYIANAADFVKKAKNHGIRVTFAFDVWGLQNYGFADPDNQHFSGLNTAFFTQAGINSRKAVWNDFISGLKNQGAPMNYIFGYSINELYFQEDQLPLSLNTGMVTTANGQTYDMSNSMDKSRMMQDAVVYMVGELRNTARQIHSEALVTIGFFYPEAVYGIDTRIVPEDVITTLGRSSADYFDLHAYPGYNSLQVIMTGIGSFGYKGKVVKPLLMGEFGTNLGYPTVESASIAMSNWMTESCNYGFDGWLSWLWNPEQNEDGSKSNYWNIESHLELQQVINGKNWGSGCFAYPCSKTCTKDTILIYDPKILGANYIWKNPTIPGSCSYNLTGNHTSNYVFPLGTTFVKLNVNDVTDNSTSTCTFKVTVQYSDSLKKIINAYDSKYISQDIPATMDINSNNKITLKYRNIGSSNWNEPFPNWDVALAPSGGNGEDLSWRALTTTIVSGDTASIVFDYVPKHFGTYNVSFQLIKNGGNRFGDNSPLTTFNVKDTKPPVFVCLKDTVLLDATGIGSKFNFLTPIATDNHKVVSVTQVKGLASGSTFPPGITTNVFVATDSMGNKGTCTFIVTVLKAYDAKFISQNVPSIMEINSRNTVTLKFKNTGALNWNAPNPNWNIALTPSGGTGDDPSWIEVKNTIVSGDTASIIFDYVPKHLGTYTVAFRLIKNGSVKFGDLSPLATFSVKDTKPPVFVCLKDTVLLDLTGVGSKFNFSLPIASDNHKVVSVIQVEGLTSGETFPIGITSNVFVAMDSIGNKDTCVFKVRVKKVNQLGTYDLDKQISNFIAQIKISNSTDCCSDRLHDFYVFVSDSPFASTDPTVTVNTPGVWSYYYPGIAGSNVLLDVNRSGRYVRVQIPGSNEVLSLAEVVFTSGETPTVRNYSGKWDFTSSPEGWALTNALSGSIATNVYDLTITASDPYLHSPNQLNLDASTHNYVTVRLKNQTSDTQAELYWITNANTNYEDVNKHVIFTIKPNDNAYTDYSIDLGSNPNWTGIIKQIRIDPSRNANTGEIDVDYIGLDQAPQCSASITVGGSTTFCQGSNVVLTSSSGASYKWMNGTTQVGTAQTYTATSSGSYTVEVTNAAGCKATSTATVLTASVPTIWYVDTDNDGKGDANTTQTSCTQPSGYVLTAGDACPTDANKLASGNCGCGNTEQSCLDCAGIPNGTAVLDVCMICSGGTTGRVAVIDINLCKVTTGNVSISKIEEIKVLPNPFSDKIDLIVPEAVVQLFDASGKLVYEGSNIYYIETSHLSNGLYLLRISTSKGVSVIKIEKQ